MPDKSVTTAEFLRHFGRYHDEARLAPLTLTKHGRPSWSCSRPTPTGN